VVGAAPSNVDRGATDISMNTFCGSQWKNGWLLGAQARFAVSPKRIGSGAVCYIQFSQDIHGRQLWGKSWDEFAIRWAKDEQAGEGGGFFRSNSLTSAARWYEALMRVETVE